MGSRRSDSASIRSVISLMRNAPGALGFRTPLTTPSAVLVTLRWVAFLIDGPHISAVHRIESARVPSGCPWLDVDENAHADFRLQPSDREKPNDVSLTS